MAIQPNLPGADLGHAGANSSLHLVLSWRDWRTGWCQLPGQGKMEQDGNDF